LKKNEKFGLLGVNGSGKTTTFRSITNEIIYEMGEIKILENDTKKDFQKIRKSIGYCPQNNALFDHLTVEETFDYYLKLKILKYYDEESNKKECYQNLHNSSNLEIKNQISNQNQNMNNIKIFNINLANQKKYLMKKFGLEKFKNTFSINLSGGNKRKLNFAIALMHNPNLILLDEPSTGVDPESRRVMWRNINEIPLHFKNFNMILSTHSMEEAEILCDTIGWMVSGNFVCLGNPEKLKIKYSPEYYINLKFKQETDVKNSTFINDMSEENLLIYFENIKNNLNQNKNFVSSLDLRNCINKDNYDSFGKLDKFIYQISSLCEKITLLQSFENNSFEIGIKFDVSKQAKVFGLILNMKVKKSFINLFFLLVYIDFILFF